MLLLDGRVVDSTQNVRLAVGTVAKHGGNPLFGEEEEWEVRFDNLYPNVLWDEDTLLYRCWYHLFIVDPTTTETAPQRPQVTYDPHRHREHGICYAYSRDGLQWIKPELGLVEMIIHLAEDRVDCELTWSPDALTWERIDPGTPIIPNGAPGDCDWGCVYAATASIVGDDGIRVYYGGSDGQQWG